MDSAMLNPQPAESARKHFSTLAQMGKVKTYKKNEILINEGETSDALFFLVAGQLKVFTRDPNGREVVYNILEPGDVCGETFLDGGPRFASVKATLPSECIVLPEARFQELISEPDFAQCLLRDLTKRLRRATQMIKDLVLTDVYGRTIVLLNTTVVNEGQERVVPKWLTQQEIADRVGATREMINHVIADLIKEGFLRRDDKRRLLLAKPLPSRERVQRRPHKRRMPAGEV